MVVGLAVAQRKQQRWPHSRMAAELVGGNAADAQLEGLSTSDGSSDGSRVAVGWQQGGSRVAAGAAAGATEAAAAWRQHAQGQG